MQQFVLPPSAGDAWGKLKAPAMPTLPTRYRPPPERTPPARALPRPEEPKGPSSRAGRGFGQRANICLSCKRPFETNEARYKLVFMPYGSRATGQKSGLGIDFCETCGPLAEEALKTFFGGDSRQPY